MIKEKPINNYLEKHFKNGKSIMIYYCPFCNKEQYLYLWRGIKKCKCGALTYRIYNGKISPTSVKEIKGETE